MPTIDTIEEFLAYRISRLIETHDEDEDGSSTAGVVSILQRLKDLVWENIPFTRSRGTYIFERLVEIAGDDDDGYDITSQLEELADEINDWN